MRFANAIKGIRKQWKTAAGITISGALAFGAITGNYKPVVGITAFILLGKGITKAWNRHSAVMSRGADLPTFDTTIKEKKDASKASSSSHVASLKKHIAEYWEKNNQDHLNM